MLKKLKKVFSYGTRVHIKKNYISEVLWCFEHKNQKLIFSFFSPKLKKDLEKLISRVTAFFIKKNIKFLINLEDVIPLSGGEILLL